MHLRAQRRVDVRRREVIIEANLDVRAAAVSGVLIVSAVVLMLILERLAGIS